MCPRARARRPAASPANISGARADVFTKSRFPLDVSATANEAHPDPPRGCHAVTSPKPMVRSMSAGREDASSEKALARIDRGGRAPPRPPPRLERGARPTRASVSVPGEEDAGPGRPAIAVVGRRATRCAWTTALEHHPSFSQNKQNEFLFRQSDEGFAFHMENGVTFVLTSLFPSARNPARESPRLCRSIISAIRSFPRAFAHSAASRSEVSSPSRRARGSQPRPPFFCSPPRRQIARWRPASRP